MYKEKKEFKPCDECNSTDIYVRVLINEKKVNTFCVYCHSYIETLPIELFANPNETFLVGDDKGKKISDCKNIEHLNWYAELMKQIPHQHVNCKIQAHNLIHNA